MVENKHKEYKLESLKKNFKDEVDPEINPNKSKFTKDIEYGIDKHEDGKRWTTFGFETETPELKKLKEIITKLIREELNDEN